MTLHDVNVWTFATFAHWLYSRALLFKDDKEDIDFSDEEVITDSYIFGDRFGVLDFSRAVFDIVLAYCVGKDLRLWSIDFAKSETKLPSVQAISHALTNLPDVSPLHRFLLDFMGYRWNIFLCDERSLNATVELLAPRLLVQLLVRTMRIQPMPPLSSNQPGCRVSVNIMSMRTKMKRRHVGRWRTGRLEWFSQRETSRKGLAECFLLDKRHRPPR